MTTEESIKCQKGKAEYLILLLIMDIETEIMQLKEELEKEAQLKNEVEESVIELKETIEKLKRSEKSAKGSYVSEDEWKVRYQTQVEMNQHLVHQRDWLQNKLMKVSAQAQNGHTADLNLDSLTEPELARLVKQLEKDRNALYNELRDTEWKLDKESKAFHKYNEVRKAYMTEIHDALKNLEMLQKKQRMMDDNVSVAKCPRHLKYLNISENQRVIDPKKGPIRKTAAVRSLPKLDTPSTDDT